MNEPSQSSSSAGAHAPEPGLPPRLLRGIEAVRRSLPRATDFVALFECFDDHVGRLPELWERSNVREHPILSSLAVAIGRQYRPGFVPLSCRIYEVGDTGFWHGAVVGSNGLACLFYDEGVGLGLVALGNALDGSNCTDLFRFGRPSLGRPTVTISPGRMPC